MEKKFGSAVHKYLKNSKGHRVSLFGALVYENLVKQTQKKRLPFIAKELIHSALIFLVGILGVSMLLGLMAHVKPRVSDQATYQA